MTAIYEHQFEENRFFFEELFPIVHLDGRQTFIFYTMSENLAHRVGLIEVLINEEKSDEQQVVIPWGELVVPTNAEQPQLN